MGLSITTQYGQIGTQFTNPQMEIDTKPVEFAISQTPPNINISYDFPQVHIDMTETWADIGYKGVVALAADQTKQSQNTVLRGIESIAQEGESLVKSIGKGNGIIANIAWSKNLDNYEFTVDVLPHVPPKISFTGGMKLDFTAGHIRTNSSLDFFPKVKAIPGTVKIYLEKEPKLEIKYVGNKVDQGI